MAKFITTKYGTKINVEGLTPEQIAKVRSTAEDKGAYGAKGAALADSFRKQAAKPAAPAAPAGAAPAQGIDTGVDPNTGQIDPNKAVPAVVDASRGDTEQNFRMNNPNEQVDEFGNKQEIEYDPVTGQTRIKKSGGDALNKANQAFLGTLDQFNANPNGGRAAAQEANYNYITKTYGRDKAREMEASKQELAQRGIPIDPTKESLWSKTTGSIDEKYQSLDDQAKNQAIMAGNQTYATDVGAIGTLGGVAQGQKGTFTAFQGGDSTLAPNLQTLINTMSDADMAKYGIDQDMKAKLKALAASKGSGSGSGTVHNYGGRGPNSGGSSGGVIIGPGFASTDV